MTPSSRCLRVPFTLVVLWTTACSAVVSPDVDRLGARLDGSTALDEDARAPGGDGGGSCGALEVRCPSGCVDLASDRAHCGDCANACPAGSACVSGVCSACAAGDPSCAGLGDPSACGASLAVCARAELCIDGACVCRPPLVRVSGTCVDLGSDPANCGAPGVRCPDRCALGDCVGDCPSGTRDCDGACVDTRSDPANCGECGRACRAGEACQDGNCREIAPARGCTSCPCSACDGRVCCVLAVVDVPYCLDADRCP